VYDIKGHLLKIFYKQPVHYKFHKIKITKELSRQQLQLFINSTV